MPTRNLYPLMAFLFLSGCMGIYEGGFECPPGVGTKCKSISEVNELINNGELPLELPLEGSNVEASSCAGEACCPIKEETLEIPRIWWAPWAFENGFSEDEERVPDGSI